MVHRLLLALVAVAVVIHLWGIVQDLPYTVGVDEPSFVKRAVAIAATGDMNPHWFGHPGSTVIYPLALAYRAWDVLAGGPLIGPAPGIEDRYQHGAAPFYLAGRLLAAFYAVLAVPLVYAIGRATFDTRTALAGTALALFCPLAVQHAQTVRTDSAATCFGLLTLWLVLRAGERPSLPRAALVGAAAGLAVSTRYFMITLLPVACAALAMRFWSHRSESRAAAGCAATLAVMLAAALAIFAATTPFFLLDFDHALASLRLEARSTHPGADGLSPLDNLWWYLRVAIPDAVTWPVAVLAAAGILLVGRDRRAPPVVLVVFVLLFLAGVSLSPLHWKRWTLQVLPLLALLAAHALVVAVDDASARLGRPVLGRPAFLAALTALLAAWPAARVVLADIRNSRPSTRIVSREWMLAHLPPGSAIATEWNAAPLGGATFRVREQPTLAIGTVDDYRRDGFDYLVASSAMYDRFLAEPARYPDEARFYETLFTGGRLVYESTPSTFRGGPIIRVYGLR